VCSSPAIKIRDCVQRTDKSRASKIKFLTRPCFYLQNSALNFRLEIQVNPAMHCIYYEIV